MSRFGPDPNAFFEAVYQADAPWDIGGPQPALAALWDSYPPASPVLDLGCGSGDVAVALAQRGYAVRGIDFSAAAIAQAHTKVATLPTPMASLVTLQVADALQPARLQQQFGAVIDCGFFHLFDPPIGERLIAEVATVIRPGGYYYLLAFSVEFAISHAPRGISVEEVQSRFTRDKGWNILALHPAEFHNRVAAPVPALAACVQRVPTLLV